MEQQKSLPAGSLSLLPDNNSRDNQFKIAIFGDVGTGKTCIFSQYLEKKFNSKYEPTIGVEFASKDIVLEDEMVRLQIWDLSGQPAWKKGRNLRRNMISCFWQPQRWIQQTLSLLFTFWR